MVEPLSRDLQEETEHIAAQAVTCINEWKKQGTRPIVKGICIDSAHSLDRDDAVWFEMREDGLLQVDITIADVAAFLPLGSALDRHSRQRVESEYSTDTVIEPMLPFRLSQDDDTTGNGVLSLSHKSVRAGVTTRVFISPQALQITHVEIFPSLILPEVITYREISDVLQQDPSSHFHRWLEYTQWLKKLRRRDGEAIIPFYVDKTSNPVTRIDESGEIGEIDANEMASHRIVEETALLANRAKARYFAATGLPYLFRIHKLHLSGLSQLEGRSFYRLSDAEDARRALRENNLSSHTEQAENDIHVTLERARYSHRRRHHAGLDEYAYAHSTSPLRRYADVVNQRLEHWLHQLLQSVLPLFQQETPSRIFSSLPANPEEDLPSPALKFIGWLGRYLLSESPTIRQHCQGKLHKYALECLRLTAPQTKLVNHHQDATRIIQTIINSELPRPPYDSGALDEVARHINQHREAKGLTEREKLAQRLLSNQMERELELAELQVLAALDIADHTKRTETMNEFSAEKRLPLTLHMAAQQRQEYRVPASILLKRMQQRQLREPADLATILVQMRTPDIDDAQGDPAFSSQKDQEWLNENISQWKDLKDQILARFSANPAFAKGFLKYLEQRYGWEIHSTHASLIEEGAIAAVLSLNHRPDLPLEESMAHSMLPPVFSIGYWGKTTRHHARITLLEALAEHALIPADKARLPRALSLMTAVGWHEFLHNKPTLYPLLHQLAEQTKLTITPEWDAQNHTFRLAVQSPLIDPQKPPMTFESRHANEEIAKAAAYQAMLRSKALRPVHAALFSLNESLSAIPLDAENAVNWLTTQENSAFASDIHIAVTHHRSPRREPFWHARLTLRLGRFLQHHFNGESTQAEVAATFAYEAALRYLRLRADSGDKQVARMLENYENHIRAQYSPQQADFTLTVPYNAIVAENGMIQPYVHNAVAAL